MVTFLLSMQNLFAQKEGNIWYFGDRAGLDFNSGAPKALTNGELVTHEGCATICDVNGKLLFYTDGISVWNKKHKKMPNGNDLKGHPSSTQSGIIVPYPNDSTKYYVFTVDFEGNAGGFQYSVVDLKSDNGYGDVTSKNTMLLPKVCEKLTAVQHENRKDIWVIVHLWESRQFAVYLVTDKGISKPDYTEIGVYYGGSIVNSIGALKVSPDGSRIATVRSGDGGRAQVFDFDNATGKISNPVDLTGLDRPYGVEFSPNGKLLYVSSETRGEVYQYNLDVADTATIKFDRLLISGTSNAFGALQLAPDKKIYLSQYGSSSLHVIENPDVAGMSCNFKRDAVYLDGRQARWGLPAFIQSFFEIGLNFTFDGSCFGDVTIFKAIATVKADKWLWNFGDPASGTANTSDSKQASHKFTAPGKYKVSLKIEKADIVETFEKEITIFEKPEVNLGPDKIICRLGTVSLSVGEAQKIKWSTGDTLTNISVSKTGTYWAELKNGSCVVSDTIKILFLDENDFSLGEDITLCEGQEAILRNKITNAIYTWSTGSNNQSITVTESGVYWLRTKAGNCEFTDSIKINVAPAPKVDLGKNVRLCEGEELVLDTKNNLVLCAWNTGETSQSIKVKTSGKYWVTVTAGNCAASDTIQVEFLEEKQFKLGGDRVICEGEQVVLINNIPDAIYFWSTGSTEQSITVNKSGKYWLHTIAGNCIKTDTVNIKVLPLPDVNLGEDTSLCEGDETTLTAGNEGAEILWNTGETASSIKVNISGKYWVSIKAGTCKASDTIILNPCPPVVYVPDAFTPDNNKVNDTFRVYCSDVASAEFKIYNRWGQLVFETNDIKKGWDGKIDGQLCPLEMYVWILRYKGKIAPLADYTQLTGVVQLIR